MNPNSLISDFHSTGQFTSRLYQAEADLGAILDLLMLARSRSNDWHYAHVGEFLFNFFMLTCHLDPLEYLRLWLNNEGKLAGYAMLGEDPSFDVQVLPEYEWAGIEMEALSWVETCLVQLRQRNAEAWGGELVSGSRADDPRRISFLEQHGFRYSCRYDEVNMLRSLSQPVPELGVPAGCQVLSMAEVSDVPGRAAAQREVWHPWTVGNVSDEDYIRFMHLPGYHPDHDLVSIAPDGTIAAYVNGWIDPLNRIGDFGPVGARQAYRRAGLTRLALLESLRRMQACGMDRVCISTGATNTAALQLYTSIGFKPVNKYLGYVKGG